MKPKPHPKTDNTRYLLTADELRSRLHYDPETGQFTRLYNPNLPNETNSRYAGKLSGFTTMADGRRAFNLKFAGKKRHYYGANLAWLYMTGAWPVIEVDHINTIASDDRWENLRPATSSQNKWNTKASKRNTTGVKGVSMDRRRGTYVAEVAARATRIRMSGFSTIEKAAAARAAAVAKLHGEFARTA